MVALACILIDGELSADPRGSIWQTVPQNKKASKNAGFNLLTLLVGARGFEPTPRQRMITHDQ